VLLESNKGRTLLVWCREVFFAWRHLQQKEPRFLPTHYTSLSGRGLDACGKRQGIQRNAWCQRNKHIYQPKNAVYFSLLAVGSELALLGGQRLHAQQRWTHESTRRVTSAQKLFHDFKVSRPSVVRQVLEKKPQQISYFPVSHGETQEWFAKLA